MDKPSLFKLRTQFYRLANWRVLKLFSNKIAIALLPTFVIVNTVLAIIPKPLIDWAGVNLWKPVVLWVGFIFVACSVFLIFRNQPDEMKSGANGGQRAKEYLDTLDWQHFVGTKGMLKQTIKEARDYDYPWIKEKEILQANQAYKDAEKLSDKSSLQDLKSKYRAMMVARFDLLNFFYPEKRKAAGVSLFIGIVLIASPHIYHFTTVLLSALPY